MRHIHALSISQLILLLLCNSLVHAAQVNAPQVVVSIKPLHSLVAGVMQGIGEPELLIPGSQSPHAFSLRPSDVRKLQSANLFIWIGEAFETPLTGILTSLSGKTEIIELMDQPDILLLPGREGGIWENISHADAETGHPAHQHERDPHLWLAISNARDIVRITRDALAAIDPQNKASYTSNAARLDARLDDLDRELRTALSSVRSVPFIVFHDAYQYFQHQYALNTVGSITISPEQQPGVKRILEVRRKLQRLEARCIFSEPQFEPKLLHTLTQNTQVKTGILDPIGADLTAGPEAYFLLMRNMQQQLVECLGDNP